MRGKLKSQIYWLPIWMWLLLFLSLNTSEHRASSVETPQKRKIDERLHPYLRQGIIAVDIATAISAKCSSCLSNGIQLHHHISCTVKGYVGYLRRTLWNAVGLDYFSSFEWRLSSFAHETKVRGSIRWTYCLGVGWLMFFNQSICFHVWFV